MKSKKPLVSVIMPVYNTGEFLVEAIESIRNQTYSNWELIAVDDGSKDDSYKILKTYAKKDKRIRVFKNKKNMGVGRTGNIAISKARGSFIARQDSDDTSTPDRLEKQVSYLRKHPNVVVIGGSLLVADINGQVIGEMKYPTKFQEIKRMLFRSMPVAQPAFMVNRNLLPKDFIWYDNKTTVAEEVELLFKLFKYGEATNLKSVVLRYRVHNNNTSLVNPKRTFIVTFLTRFRAIRKYGYRPTVLGVVVSLMQLGVVLIIPNHWIYPMYSFVRGLKKRVMGNISPKTEIQVAR